MKKLLTSIFTLIALVGLTPAFYQTAYAVCPSSTTPKGQVIDGIKESGDDCTGSGVTDFVSSVVKIISYIAGVVAIIMIIISAFKYMTAAGDAGKVSSAKNTLIYALVGIVVAVLAQVLVNFAFTQSSKASLSCGADQHPSADGSHCVAD